MPHSARPANSTLRDRSRPSGIVSVRPDPLQPPRQATERGWAYMGESGHPRAAVVMIMPRYFFYSSRLRSTSCPTPKDKTGPTPMPRGRPRAGSRVMR